MPPADRTLLWLALAIVTLVLAAIGMTRALAIGHQTMALGLNALAGLLISPISWTHHWVWIVVVLPAWAILGRQTRRRPPVVLAAAGLLLFLISPQWWWPRGNGAEYRWTILQQLTGNAYVLYAAALLVIAAAGSLDVVPEPMLEPTMTRPS